MINRQALIVVLAAAATIQTNAFVVPNTHAIQHSSPLRSTRISHEDDVEMTRKVIMDHVDVSDAYQQAAALTQEAAEQEKKLIMDIPPAPVQPPPAKKAVAPKKKGNPHKEGVFSPIVIAAGSILGEEQLNKIRGKVIAIHSDLIKSFVDTSDSDFGKAVLKQLFKAVDTDNSGYLDKEEVAVALNLLGFKWLKEKHVAKIFERADANGDEKISLEEFMVEAPKTLKTNLVKLAKSNGGEMGLLV